MTFCFILAPAKRFYSAYGEPPLIKLLNPFSTIAAKLFHLAQWDLSNADGFSTITALMR